MKTRKHILPLAAVMGSLALTAVTTNAGTIVTDFSNFSESGNLIAPAFTVEQDFTPSGASITISEASSGLDGFNVGQEVFLSDEFPNIAIYRRTYHGRPFNWEVMIVRERLERELNGSTIPAGEYLPGASEWGYFAWTCLSEDAARAKMDELLAKQPVLTQTHGA